MRSNGLQFLLALKNVSVFKKELIFFYHNNLFLKLAGVLYQTGLIQNFCSKKKRNLVLSTNLRYLNCGQSLLNLLI